MSPRANATRPSDWKSRGKHTRASRSETLVPDSDEEVEDVKPYIPDVPPSDRAASVGLRRARDWSDDDGDSLGRDDKRARLTKVKDDTKPGIATTEQVIAKQKGVNSELFERLHAQDEKIAGQKKVMEALQREAQLWREGRAQLVEEKEEASERASKAEKQARELKKTIEVLEAKAKQMSELCANFVATFAVPGE